MALARMLLFAAAAACLLAAASAFEGVTCGTPEGRCQFIDYDWNLLSTTYYENYDDEDFEDVLFFSPDSSVLDFWDTYGFTECNDVPFEQWNPNSAGRADCLARCLDYTPELIHLYRVQKVYTGKTYFYNEYTFVERSYVPTASGWNSYCNTRWSESSAGVEFPFVFPARDTSVDWVTDINGEVAAMVGYKITEDLGCTTRVKHHTVNSVCRWGAVDDTFPTNYFCHDLGLNDGVDYYTETEFGCEDSLAECDSHRVVLVDSVDNIHSDRRSAREGHDITKKMRGFLSTKNIIATSAPHVEDAKQTRLQNTDGQLCWVLSTLSLNVRKASPFSPFP